MIYHSTDTPFERVREALRSGGYKVTGTGPSFKAQCPAHEDGNPSLSVREGRDGGALLYCHGGCSTADVVSLLGLDMRDLFSEEYNYEDHAGRTLRTVRRSYDEDGRKQFRQTGITGQPTLYRLPEVLAAVAAEETVYLVEGERDCHALESLGVVATTAPMGAGNFGKVDASALAGAHVVAIKDNDDPGTRWALQVRDKLTGLAASVEFLHAPMGKDAADHVAMGGEVADLAPWDFPTSEDVPEGSSTHGRRLVLTCAASIKPRRVRWGWEGRIAQGTLALLAGREGLGKSTLGSWIAAQVTRGSLPGEYLGQPKSVLVCATEDSWEHTLVPRLMAAGADLNRVFRVEVLSADDIQVGLSLPRDLHQLEQNAKDHDAALLILDPLTSRLDGGLDTHKDSEVRRALEPLVAVADRAGMSIIGLMHHNKSGAVDPLQLVMGSKAFTAVARSVHTVIPDPDDDTGARRLFGSPKNNLGRGDLPTLGFTVEKHVIPTEEGPAETGRLVWGAESSHSISDAMRQTADGDDRTAIGEAAAWLEDYLADNGGTAPSSDCKRAGAKEGHSESAIKRAHKRLRLVTESRGFPRKSFWSLPDSSVGSSVGSPSRGDELTELTDPTGGNGSQSGQSGQSVHVKDTEPTEPTGRLCIGCGSPIGVDKVRCLSCYWKAAS